MVPLPHRLLSRRPSSTADVALRRWGNKVGNTPAISTSACPTSDTPPHAPGLGRGDGAGGGPFPLGPRCHRVGAHPWVTSDPQTGPQGPSAWLGGSASVPCPAGPTAPPERSLRRGSSYGSKGGAVSSEPLLRPDGKLSIARGAGGVVRESTDLAWVVPTVTRRRSAAGCARPVRSARRATRDRDRRTPSALERLSGARRGK
jgi:hypothetical protein